MATRNDFNQVVTAKRKYGVLEIIGTCIVWLAPVAIMAFILAWNWDELWQQKTSFHIELWAIIVLVVMAFIYIKWGRIKIREKYVADNARAEKHNPLLVICNSIVNLLPFVLGILLMDVLSKLGEPIRNYLIILLSVEGVGRLILIIDSFFEEEYK